MKNTKTLSALIGCLIIMLSGCESIELVNDGSRILFDNIAYDQIRFEVGEPYSELRQWVIEDITKYLVSYNVSPINFYSIPVYLRDNARSYFGDVAYGRYLYPSADLPYGAVLIPMGFTFPENILIHEYIHAQTVRFTYNAPKVWIEGLTAIVETKIYYESFGWKPQGTRSYPKCTSIINRTLEGVARNSNQDFSYIFDTVIEMFLNNNVDGIRSIIDNNLGKGVFDHFAQCPDLDKNVSYENYLNGILNSNK